MQFQVFKLCACVVVISGKRTAGDSNCPGLALLKVNVNGNILTDKDEVVNAWVNHFKHLSTSKASGSPTLMNLQSVISSYRRASFDNEHLILDYDVTIEEIQGCIRSMKKGKACGPCLNMLSMEVTTWSCG